jgi:predicted ATP-grasp superfamily ATP-dependent carboligase
MCADALVLDLDTRAGLSIARSLGRAGYRLSVASRDARASGLSTKYAVHRAVLPPPEVDFEAYADALIGALTDQPADVTLPTIDSSVEALHRHRDRIGRLTSPALGSFEAVEIALSKPRTLDLAQSLGLPVPRSIQVASAEELGAAVDEIGTPCVVKPTTSWREIGVGGERVAPLYLADPAGQSLAEALVRHDAPALVQELAPGTRETIKLFRDRGRTIARFAMVVDRAWPPLGGSSVMRTTAAPPEDALAHAERLVAELGLDGYSEVEFRRSSDGRPLLMEVNPRLSQSVEVGTKAGIDFARMQLEWARGGRIPSPPAAAVGLRVGWLGGDLRLLVGALRTSPEPRPRVGPVLRAIAADYIAHHARVEGFDLRDPRPMFGALGFALRSVGPSR